MVIFKAVKKFLGAAALVLGLVGAAQASVPVFETSGTSSSSFVLNAYAFSISSPGWYQGVLTDKSSPSAFEALTLNVLPGFSTKGTSLGGISGPGTFSFLASTAGVYTALLFGAPGAGGAGAFSIAVVPEIETWVMLLVGLGLIAYQLRRKNRPSGNPMLSFA